MTASASLGSLNAFDPNIPEDYNCITCHQEMEDETLTPPVTEWMESVHREVGVKCHDCHGGDPAFEDLAMDPDRGFTGTPEPADIPKMCSRCHSNAKLMRIYNQRSDQYELYKGSVHGRKLLDKGDTEAPSCVSCHGKHKILRVDDPNSMVSRNNIANTCGECHAKEEVFKKRKKPWNQLELYKKSRHYELYSQGDLLVPTCFDCHGNHGITPSSSERVRTVCFKCHTQQAEYYKASKHWEAYQKDGEPVCLDCHNNHDVLRPTVEKYTGDGDNDCVACHDEESGAYKAGLELNEVVSFAVSQVKLASIALDDFNLGAHGGFETSALTQSMEKANEKLKELHTLTHKLKTGEVKQLSEDVLKQAGHVKTTVDDMWSEIRTRHLGLIVAWVVFFCFLGVLWTKMREMEKGRKE